MTHQHIVPDRAPTKAQLVRHIDEDHPEHIFPNAAGLRRWARDELLSTHAELHAGPPSSRGVNLDTSGDEPVARESAVSR